MRFQPASLDALNFLLADVRGALGPYLNVFLVTQQHWSQSSVGVLTTLGGLIALTVQTPIGAAIDATHAKRLLIILPLAVLALGAVAIYTLPVFWPVMIANAVVAVVGDVFGPAVAALTLGLYARRELAHRMGRNAAFDHAGNVAIAAAAGVVGWIFSQRAVFLLAPVFATLAAVSVLTIPAGAIDHERARGADDVAAKQQPRAGSPVWQVLCGCRPLLIYGICTALFHLANAPLLPLVGQKLAESHHDLATAMMSACIIAAQLIMLPIAVAVGRSADRIGRKRILLIGFGVLPLRAVLYTLSDQAWWLIGVQLLDGIGAGIFGAITPLVIADFMRGTGRYNLAQGGIATLQGIGASSSGLLAGEIVDRLGYSPAFLASGAIAAAAFLLLALALPESAAGTPARLPRMLRGVASSRVTSGRAIPTGVIARSAATKQSRARPACNNDRDCFPRPSPASQ
ncbi:MAG TPA: MFS transporter [Acetobacteraceae bacterium]|jgi:MFS family permease